MNREGRGGGHEQGGEENMNREGRGGEHEQGKEENMDGQRLSLVTSPLFHCQCLVQPEQVHCPPNREGVAL